MRHLRRALAAALALLAVATAAGSWFYYDATRGPLPTTAGRLEVRGLAAPVEVLRDARGVPHIVAASAHDLYFAQGYVTAQDRLWQMDLMRRDAAGELAEIFGEAALDRDKTQRRLGLRRAAARALATLEPEVRAALESYAAGVNALADATRGDLPFEFRALRYEPRPWEPVDTLSIGKLMAQTLGSTYERDLMRASFADLDPQIYADLFVERSRYDVPFVGSDETPDARRQTSDVRQESYRSSELTSDISDLTSEIMVGSNNWVVGGERTASGKPLLANDPHLGLGLPPIWYATHLRTRDGALDVAGVTFPGSAGIVIGHNGRIAWGVTNFGPDVQDLYVEQFDESGRRYRVGDAWEEATVITERIRVRAGALGGEVEEREVSFLETRHGAVVKESGTTKYALRWTALGDVSEMPAFFYLNRARNWDEFRAALSRYPGPMQSFVFADVDNNIGYYAAGLVPVRKTGTGDRPYSGATDEGEWKAFVPFDRLPSAFNPPEQFIATANNRVVGDSVPEFYTHEWIAPFRGRRIADLVTERRGLTAADMNAIQNDVYSYPDAVFARELAKMASAQAGAEEWREVAERFGAWDGMLAEESVPAAIVTATRRVFFERIMRAKLGKRATEYQWFGRDTLYTWMIEERPDRWLPAGAGSWEALALESYREAKRDLAGTLGADESAWRYGRVNTFTLAHPMGRLTGLGALLNVPTFEVGGGPHAIKAIGVMRGWGPSMRLVVDLADVDKTTLVLPAGQSGHHASPHYADQTEAWRVGETFPFPFTEAAVRDAASDRLELVPASE